MQLPCVVPIKQTADFSFPIHRIFRNIQFYAIRRKFHALQPATFCKSILRYAFYSLRDNDFPQVRTAQCHSTKFRYFFRNLPYLIFTKIFDQKASILPSLIKCIGIMIKIWIVRMHTHIRNAVHARTPAVSIRHRMFSQIFQCRRKFQSFQTDATPKCIRADPDQSLR